MRKRCSEGGEGARGGGRGVWGERGRGRRVRGAGSGVKGEAGGGGAGRDVRVAFRVGWVWGLKHTPRNCSPYTCGRQKRDRQRDRQTETDRETERKRDRETERQRDRDSARTRGQRHGAGDPS